MFKVKVKRLIEDYGVKQEYIIELIDSNRATFKRKLQNNDFTDEERNKIELKYGSLLS